MTERDDPTARAAAFAVDADSELEHAETAAMRVADPALDAEIAEFAETAAVLGLAVPPVTPSASLRASVLAAVDADIAAHDAKQPAPDQAAPDSAPDAAPAAASVAPDPAPAGATVTPIRPWFRRPATLITAIAAVGALLFGGTAVAIGLASQSTEQVSAVDEVLLARDAQRVTADVDGGGTATWVWSASLERSVVIVDGLPELATGSTYQLWYIDDAGASPANTFAGGTREIVVDGTMPAGATLGVTVEPEGGSTAPTTDPILLITSA